MKTKVSPAMIGVAVIVLLAFCAFMYVNANNNSGPRQLAPEGTTYKQGYDGGGAHTARPAPGASREEMQKAAGGAKSQ